MRTHTMQVVIPEDRHLVVDVPETIRSGPAELILVVREGQPEAENLAPAPEALMRWDDVAATLGKDVRPFHSLTREEKMERHRKLRGIGRGILPSSAAIARAKLEEVDLEDARFGRS